MRAIHTTKLIAALSILFLASCSTEQAVFTASEDVVERIDMVIEGNDTESIYEQSNGNVDLVDYNFYGSGSHQFDIRVNIGNDRTLTFRLNDDNTTNLWEQEGGYSLFATSDLEDKQKHVSVEMKTGSEVPTYRSHVGNSFPQGTYVNVFNIVEFNPANNEILCRIVNLPIANSDGSNDILTINGTFRGAVDFLN